MKIPIKYHIRDLPNDQTYSWLLNKHYAKRIPNIMFAFGLYDNNKELQGICTFGMPPCHFNFGAGIFKNLKINTYELTRLVVNEGLEKNTLSFFVSKCLNSLKKPACIVSFADPNNNHHGYIYQATNWIYTGLTQKGGKDKQWILNEREYHAKTITVEWMKKTFGADKYNNNLNMTENWKNLGGTIEENELRKFRYLYFLGNKKQVKEMKEQLLLPICEYPKGNNVRYDASYKVITNGVLF